MRTLVIAFLVLMSPHLYAQVMYDRIVTTLGDSMVCYIDSISDSTFYIRMKVNYNWVNTTVDSSEVMSYSLNRFKPRDVYLPKGSAYGYLLRQNTRQLKDVQRDGILLGADYLFSLTASYQRIQPLLPYVGALGRIGAGYTANSGDDFTVNGDLALLAGNNRSYLELGIGFYYPFLDEPDLYVIPNLSYRYIGFKGLEFKLGWKWTIYTNERTIEEWGEYESNVVIQLGYLFRI